MCLFLVLPHVADLRKTEASGQVERSSATKVETFVMRGLKGDGPLSLPSDVVAMVKGNWGNPHLACAEGAGSQHPERCVSVSGQGPWALFWPCQRSSIPQGKLRCWMPSSTKAQSKGGHCHGSLRRTHGPELQNCPETTVWVRIEDCYCCFLLGLHPQ